MADSNWDIWIDRGGTFTDLVARDSASGAIRVIKLLSVNPGQYDDAALAGIRQVLGLAAAAPIPAGQLGSVRIGTTLATNALLERKGEPVLLVVNQGFAELPTIGHQARPRLFDLDIRKPLPLHAEVLEVVGRVSADGATLAQLDETLAKVGLDAARARGITACAIALIHSWKYPEMEQRLAMLARAAGFTQVSVSSDLSPLVGLLPRIQTATADAYLAPVIGAYAKRLANELAGVDLAFMQSGGGLTPAARLTGKDAVLSGPAGGVVGAVRTASAAGEPRIIAFDMGGTSTDVSLYDGHYERVFDAEVAGVSLRTPMMAVETVAAGGGSILAFEGADDAARFRVGPQSAGSHPGPACYRKGGPLTITDANVMLGRVRPDRFPKIFGETGDQPIDADIVAARFAALADEIAAATDKRLDPRAIADGFVDVAVANMARAIRRISLEKGHDPAEFALACFGGAGGQHACRLADALGMTRILIHPMAGVLSALGIGLAEETIIRRQAVERALDSATAALAHLIGERLAGEARAQLGDGAATRLTVQLRYQGTDTALDIELGESSLMRAAFEAAHTKRFGFADAGRAMVIESVTAEATRPGAVMPALHLETATQDALPDDTVRLWAGGDMAAPLFVRDQLRAGHRIAGPALIAEAIGAIMVEPGWAAEVLATGDIRLTRAAPAPAATAPDAVALELFASRMMAAAERMGAVLRAASTSVNIKERLDFSCAVFDAEGQLIANAPHVPVHLGAMGESVRVVLKSRGPDLKPGDMIALNNPFNGGTHLPDVTVIAPVFDEAGTLRFFVANRGHHADIGGRTPGSTPPDSTRLEEEGVVIDDFLLVDGGAFQEQAFRRLLADAPWPARNPDANVADIRAQVAANLAGAGDLLALMARQGWPATEALIARLMVHAEMSVRRVIDRLSDGAFDLELDDGAHLRVAVSVDHDARSACIDFTGTDDQRAGNFNAPPAVTRAAVLYAFRCLVGEDLPLNEGCLRPLTIIAPDGSFLAPAPGAAVVAGNTEVSQALVNAVFASLSACAAAQGTMNNLLIGDDSFQYYETICGGAGAGPGFSGASAVQTHMTNTRITDPEVLEMRCPVRLEAFSVRHGSGGSGRWRGGDGARRVIRALKPMTVTLVSSSRRIAPFGLAGGSDGLPGRQWIARANGDRDDMSGVAQAQLLAGDAIVIETPGGGGWGSS